MTGGAGDRRGAEDDGRRAARYGYSRWICRGKAIASRM
jgi:hypothetical protein